MSYTAQEIYDMSIVIMDELSNSGTVDPNQTKEYRHKAPRLLDMFQKEMAKSGDLYKTFEISCIRKKNLLGDTLQCTPVENNGDTQSYSAKGVNCFYFEVDGDCTVTFPGITGKYSFNGGPETVFNETITITVPEGTTSFLPCKGILDATADATMTFSGTYYYRHIHRALCPYKYPTADKVPDFKPWYKVTMPDDFKNRSQVINEYPMWQYEQDASHKWEGNKDLYIQFAYEGIVRIKYIPIPTKITDLAQTMEIDDITATSGAYYLAEHFAMSDMNDELAARCRSKFNELKKESMLKMPLSNAEIIDVYGFGG